MAGMHGTFEPISKEEISVGLVKELVASQFPKWADLEVRKVLPGGWDNLTFRLGQDLLVRLPSATRYTAQVAKEHLWLPVLSKTISFEIPHPIAMGAPSDKYPWNWSVYRWIPGDVASTATNLDKSYLAEDTVRFLTQLQSSSTSSGPLPGEHNFYRGGPLEHYGEECYQLLQQLEGIVDTNSIKEIIGEALISRWTKTSVWVHGDLTAANMLVDEGKLKAVIDFGSSAVGDPACDLAIAWTFFEKESRESIRTELKLDNETWNRGKGWVLWKAMLEVRNNLGVDEHKVSASIAVINEVLS
jgi:aminoglycoside phosphotransferase (APT) family kinase protein